MRNCKGNSWSPYLQLLLMPLPDLAGKNKDLALHGFEHIFDDLPYFCGITYLRVLSSNQNQIVSKIGESSSKLAGVDITLNAKCSSKVSLIPTTKVELVAEERADEVDDWSVESTAAYGSCEVSEPDMYKGECLILAVNATDCQYQHINLGIKCQLHKLGCKVGEMKWLSGHKREAAVRFVMPSLREDFESLNGRDYMPQHAFVIVAGHLQVETYVCALSSVNTFAGGLFLRLEDLNEQRGYLAQIFENNVLHIVGNLSVLEIETTLWSMEWGIAKNRSTEVESSGTVLVKKNML
ncbi:hypothetical protein SUGI_0245830 [Cryptomeria japonica]|nr:hypothetical protein SUGI_0245830 [Cryptomeria japonica]